MFALIKKICIADDDAISKLIFKKVIQSLNVAHHLSEFKDGKELLAHLKSLSAKDAPDLIFLDVNMPVMGGWEFIAEFQKSKSRFDKQIDVYIITNSSHESDIKKIEDAGIRDYISKPFTADKLKSILSD